MLILCSAGDDASIAEQHVELEHRVVHQAVAMRRGFDADAGYRAAERDGLQLRHHRGHQAVHQAFARQVLVADHALGVDPARGRVDLQHLVEAAHVEPPARDAFAVAEEIRRFLGEPDRALPVPKPRG